ncbi:unnamed protein product [Penicillium salamii]|uniref:Uncharacterized protein n=1 Tax=Penicillium salamii TaxID=1612424 RepID=A0A9W4IV73_9EURO|nr:unnamed protein product [Penicillium salamii]CAG8043844.1 unnamed protein product [Penicillium salamii]CAG8339347.1 unnamed protein product [Penicillium salamii]CAG8345360.1 unnamed protein product [Penicillium salamii]CAG8345380.1 unnamed protein product [Penicillium salamii]
MVLTYFGHTTSLWHKASIVKIAGAGFRLSLLLNAAACQLAQSKLEIHSIAKGISLFALTLKHVGQTIEGPGIDRSPEATEKALEIAGQGQLIFVEIEHMLDKLKATDRNEDLMRLSLQERLKWCFPKQHVTYLLAQVETLKLSLIVMLRILQLGNVIKANTDDGIDTDSLASAADDTIAQEKAESQNMIIVRYWAVKRLDRLWDLVEQEAVDAAKDPINQKINANYSNTAFAVNPLVAAARGAGPTRLAVVTFGESDVGLSDMERSPKDMVQLSEMAMNRLLSMWVPHMGPSRPYNHGNLSKTQPRVYISDTDDHSDELDFDSPEPRGYYLEGKTDNWRNPHSQEARQHAAKLRQEYSRYQAHVESEPEPDESKHRSRDKAIDSSEEEKETLHPHTSNMRRPHSNSFSDHPIDRQPYPYAYPSGSYPPPSQTRPHPPPAQHNQPKYQPPTAPRSIPTTQPNHATPIPMPVPIPRQNHVHFDPYRPRSRTNPLSTSTPESRSSDPRLADHRASPPRSAQRSPSHRRDRDRDHDREREREEAKQRHKSLTRNATRGLVGVGAIAGFMDALEAFSIL